MQKQTLVGIVIAVNCGNEYMIVDIIEKLHRYTLIIGMIAQTWLGFSLRTSLLVRLTDKL